AQFDPQFTSGQLSEREMWNQTWNVNVSGTQVLTSSLVPLLLQSSDPRILFLTSGLSSLTRTSNLDVPANRSPAKGWPKTGFSATAYRSSKTGLNMLVREWHRVLKEDGVKVWAIAPGFLATGLGVGDPEVLKTMGAGDTQVAGPFVRSVVEGEWDGEVGRVVSRDGVQEW
ncbi:hypothetical protein P170DRAFT_361519, partial [Aspergillus steynii IBT 23096]